MRRPLAALALALSIANCSGISIVDTSPVYAMEANDTTVIISGCGNQPVSGFTYCRVHEGQDTTQFGVSLVAPPVQCRTKPCVTFKVFDPKGQVIFGQSVPDNQTQIDVKWSQLVGAPAFAKDQAGYWQVVEEWTWVDTGGNEHQSAALGEIRLRVLDASYVSLSGVHDDKNFAWEWTSGIYHMAMTTKGRSTVYGGAIP
jgi:hypothetical protein